MLDAGTDVSRSDLHVGEERLRAAGTLYCCFFFFGGRCWGRTGRMALGSDFLFLVQRKPQPAHIFLFKSNQKTGRAEKIP